MQSYGEQTLIVARRFNGFGQFQIWECLFALVLNYELYFFYQYCLAVLFEIDPTKTHNEKPRGDKLSKNGVP